MPMTKRLKRTASGLGPSAALAARAELRGPTATAAAASGALPFDDDDQVLQNAEFGLAHVPTNKPKRTQSWSSKLVGGKVAPAPKQRKSSSSKKGASSGGGHRREQWLQLLQFADAVTTMLVVPLRVGFFFDPFNSPQTRHVWTTALTVFTILDSLSVLLQFLPLIFRRISNTMSSTSSRRGSNDGKTAVSDMTTFRMMSRMPSKIIPEGLSTKRGFTAREDDEAQDRGESAFSQSRSLRVAKTRVSKASRRNALARLLGKGVLHGPWELLLCVAGEYNLSHVGGLFRLAMAFYLLPDSFSKAVLKQFRSSTIVRNLAFSTIAVIFHGIWIGLYLCHLSAAGYMFIAHYECGINFDACPKSPIPGCWVLKDDLERGTQWRMYVRTMYWASKTVTTLGQGDLVPATMMETNYCIVVQFISGLWATCFLSATGFVFSRRDAKMQESTATRFEQSRQFVIARQLSKTTMDDVTSYFRYMQRTRNGVDEASVLAGLPNRYRAQCSHQIKQNYVKRIPFFRNQQGAFLRAILDALQEDFFSPNQVIVDFDSTEELLIVQAGEVRVTNAENVVVRRLLSGNFYADYALMRVSNSAHRLVAESPSEIWWLPRRDFEETVSTYFPAGKRALVLGRRVSNLGEEIPSVNDAKDLALRKFMDKIDRDTAKSVKSVATWRFPSSRLRSRWRKAHCACLLFVAIEVPVHIAFHRNFSALSPSRGETISTVALPFLGVCVGLIVEVFCYLDWYLQAYVFVRRSSDGDGGGDDGAKSDSQAPAHDLIIERKQIFRHYVENDDLVSDCLANLPISFIWDLVPKPNLASHAVMWMRFFRLLRLLRLRQLPHAMRIVMTERNLSPPTQLLVFNTTACIVLANLAASIFYLVADFTHVSSGMSSFAEVLDHTPVSSSVCLSDSSVSGNCTWFMYDYSQYGIDLSYLRSMHWSLVLLSTVGYGDILSFSDAECFVGFWWIFAGAVICYFTASATSSVISHWRVLRVAKSEKLEEINRTLMSFRSLSPETITVIQRYYLTTWKMNGSGVTEDEVLGLLPKSVRSRISRELYASISECQLFDQAKGSDSLFIQELVVNARSEIFLAGDVITGMGHTAEESFVIENGAVEIFVEVHNKEKVSAAPSSTSSRFKNLQWTSFALLRNAMVKTTTSEEEDGWLSLSVAVLRKLDLFGEESLSYPDRSVYAVSARALTSTQVVVVSRQSVLELIDRFPDEVAKITAAVGAKMENDRRQLAVIQHNIKTHTKIAKLCGYLGLARADVEDTRVTENYVIHPDSAFARIWSALVSLILLYNFYQITFRLAFLPRPSKSTMEILNGVDNAGDALLMLDIYLKWNHFGYTDAVSGKVLDRARIRRRYQDGWLKWDLLSMLPVYFPQDAFKMVIGRLPRLLKTPRLMETLHAFEEKLQKRFLTGGAVLLSAFDMIKFLLFFLSAAHHIGSLYYLLGRLQLEYGVADASWITSDAVLSAYPDRVEVHYIRSIYWCLETFTVVCFGDVIARNPAETVFASATCILGWIFIGQVIGRMTSLVLNMDKEAHAHAERVNDFEEYAKRRCLPPVVRERAKECAEYKSKTLLELNAHQIFSGLPRQLRTSVFDEAYGKMLRVIPEFEVMSGAQIQAIASALILEIYMRQDIIFAEGSVTTRLFMMKEGRGELFSESSAMVFASVHEGVMFGDTAFFIPGLKHFASARAHTSCQVLQLERRSWKALWPESVRRDIEEKLIPIMREKHRVTTSSFLSIVKNFEMSKNTVIQRPVKLHRRRTLRALMIAEKGKLERQLLVDCFIGTRPKRKSRLGQIAAWVKAAISTLPTKLSVFVKWNTQFEDTGSQGKLSAAMIAGVRLRNAITKVQSARPDKETMWSRHARKLHILRMLDNKKNEAEAELEVPGAAGMADESNGGKTRTRSGHLRLQLARRKSTGDQMPMASTRTDEASMYSGRSQKFSGNSVHSSREDKEQPAVFRRHSIQMNNSDILTKFVEMRDLRQKLDDAEPNRKQSEDGSTRRLSGGLFALDNRLLRKGKSSASLVTTGVPLRQRSNSLHELLVNSSGANVRRRVSFYARALGDVITSAFKSQQSATQLYGIWCEPPLPPSFVLEGSGFRRAWDTTMLAICLYYVLVIPFRASFTYEYLAESGFEGSVETWFFVEYVMDAFCVADFMLRKNYFSYVHRGEIVTDAQQIRDHYFHEGSYVIDMISLLPLEVLAPAYSLFRDVHHVTWYHIAVLRLTKILRITHLHDLSERLQQMLIYDFKLKIVRPSLVYWVRITLDFVLGAHWVACIMYAVAFNYVEDDGHLSWLKQPGMLTFSGCGDVACVGSTSVATKYSRSYHFSMGAITTVSYGDIAPLNAPETAATTLVIVMSIVLFGMLSGGFFQLLEMEFGRRADYEQRVAYVAQYMQFHRFHPRMWKQMQLYFAVHWAESKGMNEDEVLRGLTTSVKQDLAFFVMEDFVKNMRLLASAEPAFARAMVTAFQQELFVRNDTIISEGDTERSLYVIESGLVSVRLTKKSTLEQIEVIKGRYEFIGEKSLIFDIPRTATCIALCACSVLILTLDKYEAILEEFPEYREKNVREWMFTRGGSRAAAPTSRKPMIKR